MEQLQVVAKALTELRAPIVPGEADLHAMVTERLKEAGIPYLHEFSLGRGCRIDFLCGTVGIEIKRGLPARKSILQQVTRYLNHDAVRSLILLTERHVDLPDRIREKPVLSICLSRLWGISLPSAVPVTGSVPESAAIPEPSPADDTQPAEEMPEVEAPTAHEEPLAEECFAGDAACLPPYLRFPADHEARTYGTLSYNRKTRAWVVRGDPSVTEMCKRLFPGSAGSKRGEARFTAHARVTADLCWFMQRYPLTVAQRDQKLWEKALQDVRTWAVRREKAARMPERMAPPDSRFCGTLKPFQEEGLAYLFSHDRCLLADEMGLGKTVQALAWLAAANAFPALIVPPAHLTRNWSEEAARFLRLNGRAPRIHVIRGLKPYDLPEADLYVMHYLLLRGWKDTLADFPCRAVIFDEIQELRHSGTDKYSAASILSESCERVAGLSGTPIYNRGGEIWNVINILDYHFLGDWESFSREWCTGYGNAVVLKPELLGDYLRREGLMLRRTKQQVLSELPPKRRLVQELDWNDKLYSEMMKPVIPDILRWKTDESMTPSIRAMLEESISQRLRQATGAAKAPYVCQFVRALLEGGEKVLLFAHHHQVMDIYQKELKAYSPGFITGRETSTVKDRAVERFMDGRTDLLCISLRSASGLNLQRATCVVFGELDWSPAVHTQAEDRAHRIGQEDSLLCYYLVSPRGSDAAMQEALGLKVSQFVGLMGDRPADEAAAASSASMARKHVEQLIAQLKQEE